MRWLGFTCALLTLVAAACDSDKQTNFFQDLSKDPGFPGSAGDRGTYQSLFSYTPDPACKPNVPRVLHGATEVRVFRGNGISMDDVGHFLGGLKRYYDFYGVDLYTRHEAISVGLDHAVVYNDEAVANMMQSQGMDPACADSRYATLSCERAMGAAIFHNVKEFLRLYAEPKQDVINVVLLKHIAAWDFSAEYGDAWGIAGLGLSEALVNSDAAYDLGVSLADILNESDFSPTVFIGVNLVDFILRDPDVVIAHEFGHAYGLEHVDNTDNLMNPEAVDCNQSLSSSQLSMIEKQTSLAGNLLATGRYAPHELLSFTHRAPEILSILRKRIAAHGSAPEGQP
jgi:hypothetical protein